MAGAAQYKAAEGGKRSRGRGGPAMGPGHGTKIIYTMRSSFSFLLSIMGTHRRQAEE